MKKKSIPLSIEGGFPEKQRIGKTPQELFAETVVELHNARIVFAKLGKQVEVAAKKVAEAAKELGIFKDGKEKIVEAANGESYLLNQKKAGLTVVLEDGFTDERVLMGLPNSLLKVTYDKTELEKLGADDLNSFGIQAVKPTFSISIKKK